MLSIPVEDLVPIGHLVIVEVEPLEEKVGNFFVAPDPTDRRRDEIAREIGTIIAIGPSAFDGRSIIDETIKVGDRVMWSKYSGEHYELDGRDIRVLNDDHLRLKIKTRKKDE